jgi:hypothetical protein
MPQREHQQLVLETTIPDDPKYVNYCFQQTSACSTNAVHRPSMLNVYIYASPSIQERLVNGASSEVARTVHMAKDLEDLERQIQTKNLGRPPKL